MLSFLVPHTFIWQASGSFLAFWGHLAGPREQQKGHLGFRSWIFADFSKFRDPILEAFPALWNNIGVFNAWFQMFRSTFFWFESGVELEKTSI